MKSLLVPFAGRAFDRKRTFRRRTPSSRFLPTRSRSFAFFIYGNSTNNNLSYFTYGNRTNNNLSYSIHTKQFTIRKAFTLFVSESTAAKALDSHQRGSNLTLGLGAIEYVLDSRMCSDNLILGYRRLVAQTQCSNEGTSFRKFTDSTLAIIIIIIIIIIMMMMMMMMMMMVMMMMIIKIIKMIMKKRKFEYFSRSNIELFAKTAPLIYSLRLLLHSHLYHPFSLVRRSSLVTLQHSF